jgi:outer membrane protein assembly factor BamB
VGSNGIYHSGQGLLSTTPSAAPPTGNAVRMFSLTRPSNCYTVSEPPFFPCPHWATPIDGATATSPVIGPGEETVYTGTDAGTVYALDAATGAIRWSAPAGAPVTASPALADGTLFVPTGDGDLVAFDATTGAVRCSAPTGSPLTVQPAVAGGVVYTGSADGSLHAFPAAGCGAATCRPLWSASTGSRITGPPAVTGGQLYVGTQDGRLIAYAPRES